MVFRDHQVTWAGAVGDACEQVPEALRAPHPNKRHGCLDLERVTGRRNATSKTGVVIRTHANLQPMVCPHLHLQRHHQSRRLKAGVWTLICRETTVTGVIPDRTDR